jgi:hypothetical protein
MAAADSMTWCDTVRKGSISNGNSTTQHNHVCTSPGIFRFNVVIGRFFGKLSYVTKCRRNWFINRFKIGIGVGIGVGVVALLAIGLCYFATWPRRSRSSVSKQSI